MEEDSPARMAGDIVYREDVKASDISDVRTIAQSSGFFSSAEQELAVELVQERLEGGPESGYHFIFAERSGRAIGFTCFGPIPGTESSFDLYWIALLDSFRGMGVGKRLMALTEDRIYRMGGRRIYVETSARKQYDPTRRFYSARGYMEEATLKDFYAPGDSKVIYVKVLEEVGKC